MNRRLKELIKIYQHEGRDGKTYAKNEDKINHLMEQVLVKPYAVKCNYSVKIVEGSKS